jgi:hypothetical protein
MVGWMKQHNDSFLFIVIAWQGGDAGRALTRSVIFPGADFPFLS